MSTSVLHKVAYFHLCECQKHGFVVLADGRRGPECASKKTALEDVARAVSAHLMSPIEAEMIRESLNASRLPLVDLLASPETLLGCVVRSEEIQKRTQPEENFLGFVPSREEDFGNEKEHHEEDVRGHTLH